MTITYACDIITNSVSELKEEKMDYSATQERMRTLCRAKNWRTLLELIDEGYKGTYVILRILQEAENDVVAGEIAKAMNVSTARVASALNTLEKKNYVKREVHSGDARKVVIRLTEHGEKALEERNAIVAQMLKPMLGNLSEDEKETLFTLLSKFLGAV